MSENLTLEEEKWLRNRIAEIMKPVLEKRAGETIGDEMIHDMETAMENAMSQALGELRAKQRRN